MRLRNKPWAVKLVNDHPESVLQNPDPSKKIDWRQRFAKPDQPISIEIGSGKGRFITTLAKEHPERNFVAIELQTTAAGIILRTKLTEQLDNLQILRGDALNINYFFAPHSIDHLYLNFSDPWPKARHEKRRLTYRAFLERYQAVLKSAGELEFKTDNAGLFAYSLQSFNNYGMIFDFVSVDLHHEAEEILNKNIETEYEHKFAERGNPIYAVHAHFVEE
ncbi:MAG: tRNA (guanosine(46)-N7)-methyltransferase TrmB [Lactobacillus sp.]|jgi:tRNA (guanine-N7-)-methyltransferase|nr:tRNA (guanosine(46)-N7)-methyltransferase TrmB [Lactobacillus sp.]MCH3906035.1 tRNA (guanosine(46)-N7)-methyltransferase TrmB [Lactobacillus sp.]MCH3990391.1 tRNA (guanosine(46)-N7)-methyltransferase TrmB [Lactobacillus sp.]MCH4068894.1 tRNA (guanosine(46)-N7)-methyltransferase TrmB [Lactobacillus sp.]MCI1303296.1 tRNA (guanosine(46)-N7)-methyltransferase TrmB [Lactobacillus sp.]